MQRYEYKVVPAPGRAEKVRGAKTTAERFARTLESVMNDLGNQGWEYVRADTLPVEERTGFTGRTTVYQNLLVFRRAKDATDETAETAPAESQSPRLSFPRLRIGAARQQTGNAPRIEADPEPTNIPKLGPATED